MLLRLLILTGLLALVPAIRAGAQVSPDDARRTLEVLQDPQKRDQLLTTLRTIAQTPPPAATPAPAAVPIAPDSLGAEVLMGASGLLNHVSDEVIAALRSDPQRAATVVLAAGHGDRLLVAQCPAGHGLAPGAGAGGRPRGRVGGAPRHTAPDPGSGPPGSQRRRAGGGRRRDARRKRRDRSRLAAAATWPSRCCGACRWCLAAVSSNCCRRSLFCWSATWSRRPRLAARIGHVSCSLP